MDVGAALHEQAGAGHVGMDVLGGVVVGGQQLLQNLGSGKSNACNLQV